MAPLCLFAFHLTSRIFDCSRPSANFHVRRQRSRQHCQQLGDLLRVAGGVGSDAAAEAADGRAIAAAAAIPPNGGDANRMAI